MIPVDNTQTIDSLGQCKNIGRVTTTTKNIPFLVNAVTDRIYKDKQGAIIREYSTNAWDEHVKAKLPVSDIVVTLPTLANPVFSVRDFGPGLLLEQVRDIYCILGESTKRESNDLNGQLGLGCKSAFGYGDSFMVTSFINGEKTVYNIIKGDDQNLGQVIIMDQSVMGEDDRTGIEIAIPIQIDDLSTIHSKAADFFKYWTVLPTIKNMDEAQLERMSKWINNAPFLSGNNWEIRPRQYTYSGRANSYAVMGQVAYPIDWGMLRSKMALTPEKRMFSEILQSNSVILKFPIGALKFTISREELEYTETTYKNLEAKLEEIFSALEAAVIAKFDDAQTIWEAKRIYLSLFGKNFGDREERDEETKSDSAIKVLDGDFYRLESLFTGKIFWKGIPIITGRFPFINRFDLGNPTEVHEADHDPSSPCMVTYIRKKKRVKRLPCKKTKDNAITPYTGTKVVIVDSRNASMAQSIARYYLLKDDNVAKVHILRFANDEQRNAFFKEFNFDTAQYTLLSTVIDDIKQWVKNNRKTYSSGGGGGTVLLKYINVETGGIQETGVSLRDLEDGGVFLTYYRKEAHLNPTAVRDMGAIAEYLSDLAKYSDWDLDRVYCLPIAKTEAKWFQKAKQEGLWIELHEFLADNSEIIPTEEMKLQYHYNKWRQNCDRSKLISRHWSKALKEAFNGKNLSFNGLMDDIVRNYKDFSDLKDALGFFKLPEVDFGQPPRNFGVESETVLTEYPLLQWMNLTGYEGVEEKKLEAIIEYIQSIDEKKSLTLTEELVA